MSCNPVRRAVTRAAVLAPNVSTNPPGFGKIKIATRKLSPSFLFRLAPPSPGRPLPGVARRRQRSAGISPGESPHVFDPGLQSRLAQIHGVANNGSTGSRRDRGRSIPGAIIYADHMGKVGSRSLTTCPITWSSLYTGMMTQVSSLAVIVCYYLFRENSLLFLE